MLLNQPIPGWWDELHLDDNNQLEYVRYVENKGWTGGDLTIHWSGYYHSSDGEQRAAVSGEINVR